MDELDVAILREMSREKVCWWGGMDPRLSTDLIAKRLELAGSTVRARLATWTRAGFLQGYSIIPNPALLGASFARGSVRVDDARAKPAVLDALSLVGGVAGVLDHVGPWLEVSYILESPADLARRRSLVGRIAGVDEAGPCEVYTAPAPTLAPTAADWRLLRALREQPQGSVASLAASAGISTRTFTRRYEALVRGRALFFMPVLDFTRFDGGVVVRLLVHPEPGADAAAIGRALREAFPHALELWNPWGATESSRAMSLLLHLPSAGLVEDALRVALETPGVARVHHAYPRAWHVFPQWFDDRLARVAAARTGADEAPASLVGAPGHDSWRVAPRT